MAKKLTRKLEYTAKARKAIHKRDGERCVFCEMGYHMELIHGSGGGLQIMHIVPRARMGMGIEENGVLGCVEHHALMDNGNKGLESEMQELLKARMRFLYPGWTEGKVTYHKWDG